MSSQLSSALFDDLGPRGKRISRITSGLALLIVLFGVYIALKRFNDNDQFESKLWKPLTDWPVIKFLLLGFLNTVKAAAVAMVFAMVIGALMALGRLAQNRPVRWLTGIYVELFRALPLVLMILFAFLVFPRHGLDISPFVALVLGLTLYNSAMLAEVFRAGILSLDRGQREAAESLGMSYWQAMGQVIIPQAARRMAPSIVSQLVTLLKDTGLGYVVTYEELLRRSRSAGQFGGNLLQTFLFAAVLYFLVNFALSRFATWLERRQRRRFNAGAVAVTGGAEDLTAVNSSADAKI